MEKVHHVITGICITTVAVLLVLNHHLNNPQNNSNDQVARLTELLTKVLSDRENSQPHTVQSPTSPVAPVQCPVAPVQCPVAPAQYPVAPAQYPVAPMQCPVAQCPVAPMATARASAAAKVIRHRPRANPTVVIQLGNEESCKQLVGDINRRLVFLEQLRDSASKQDVNTRLVIDVSRQREIQTPQGGKKPDDAARQEADMSKDREIVPARKTSHQ